MRFDTQEQAEAFIRTVLKGLKMESGKKIILIDATAPGPFAEVEVRFLTLQDLKDVGMPEHDPDTWKSVNKLLPAADLVIILMSEGATNVLSWYKESE